MRRAFLCAWLAVRRSLLLPLPIQKKWGEDTFLVIEKWESMDALKAHAAAPHMAAYGAKTKELLAGRVIHILTPA